MTSVSIWTLGFADYLAVPREIAKRWTRPYVGWLVSAVAFSRKLLNSPSSGSSLVTATSYYFKLSTKIVSNVPLPLTWLLAFDKHKN